MKSYPVLVLFDGVCNLCNSSVDLLVRVDKDRNLRFASLQSPAGQFLLKKFNRATHDFDSFLIYENEALFEKSDAALKVCTALGGWWRFFLVFKLVPRMVRNWIYAFVAVRRYQLFGRKESCRLPSKEEQALFLESEDALFSVFDIS